MEESYLGSASCGVLHLSWWQGAEVVLDIPSTHKGERERKMSQGAGKRADLPLQLPSSTWHHTYRQRKNDEVLPFKAARVPRTNSCPKTEHRRGSAPGTVTRFLWHQALPVRFVSWSLGPVPLQEESFQKTFHF